MASVPLSREPRGSALDSTPLSAAHGAGLSTTAGITSVISLVAAVSVLGQCASLAGAAARIGAGAVALLVLGAGCLYEGRNAIGMALDIATAEPRVSMARACRGLTLYHLGMACVFAGSGLASVVRLPLRGAIAWVVPLVALALAAGASARAIRWARTSPSTSSRQ